MTDDPNAAPPSNFRTGRISLSSDDDVARIEMRDEHVIEIDESGKVANIGNDRAPNPVDYLCAATAGCQVEVLKQCFVKARVEDYAITGTVRWERRQGGDVGDPMPDHLSTRVGAIEIDLSVETTEEYESQVSRCLDVAERACIVSRSIESGVDVSLDKELLVE